MDVLHAIVAAVQFFPSAGVVAVGALQVEAGGIGREGVGTTLNSLCVCSRDELLHPLTLCQIHSVIQRFLTVHNIENQTAFRKSICALCTFSRGYRGEEVALHAQNAIAAQTVRVGDLREPYDRAIVLIALSTVINLVVIDELTSVVGLVVFIRQALLFPIVDCSLPLTKTKNVNMLRAETGGLTTTRFSLLRSETPSVEILPQLGHDF